MNSDKLLEEEFSRSEAKVRKRKAACPDLPREALQRLEKDEDASVRAAVAGNSNASPEMLGRLAEDKALEVRKNVAKNESVPLAVLERLLVDWEGASSVAARHPKVPEETKKRLVRAGTREDFSAPFYLSVFETGYAEDLPEGEGLDTDAEGPGPGTIENGWASRSAITGEERKWLRGLGPNGQALVAGHPETPLEEIRRLIEESGQQIVRLSAALNPGVSSELLRQLAGDEDEFVREAVGLNPTAPPPLLRELYFDSTLMNKRLIASHPHAPEKVLTAALGNEASSVRQAALQHDRAPHDLIRLLVRAGSREDLQGLSSLPPGPISAEERERLAQLGRYGKALVAVHPDTTESQSRKLAQQIPSLDGMVGPFSPDQLREVLSEEPG